ncbi:MAG TPA: 2-phosphosulfolactate phosphatase [bacterium]|nr:2-phosphosulfolactate phosphatase [bacterium]
MELHVAFLPEEAGDVRRRVAVVVDVLRATTSILTLLERGCAEVLIARDVATVRRYAERAGAGRVRTAGEEGGLAPAGFDFGNSPAAFARAEVEGLRIVMATTNGTRALLAVRAAPLVFAACLRNRAAAARAAAGAAVERGLDLTVVCSGREGRFSLDDAYTAGAIADAVIADVAGREPCTLTDAVLAARALYDAWPDAAALFRQTAAGRNTLAIGLEEDLRYCVMRDCSELVPRVGDGVTLLET